MSNADNTPTPEASQPAAPAPAQGPKEGFLLTSSPHTFAPASTRKIMYIVIATLLPAVAFSIALFGPSVLLLYVVGVVGSVATEAVTKIIRKQNWRSSLDGSAIITGLLLVMTLPPTLSPIAALVGSVVAIFIGKEVFGGLGANIFNPALVGRAFLAAAYPVSMTTWKNPSPLFGFLHSSVDATTSATPLAAAKFDHVFAPNLNLLLGQTGGSIGETSTVLLALGGLVLIILGLARWPIVVSFLGSVFLFGELFHVISPALYPSGLFQLFAGGLALGAFYMATDMVTSPFTNKGGVIFGIGAGVLVIIIRLFGGYPEGVMYAILLMNAVTPIINRYVKTRTFGSRPQSAEASK